MKCSDTRPLLSLYLDGATSRDERMAVELHLRDCVDCDKELNQLKRTHELVASVGRKPAPRDLALRLRVALSQEMAASRRSPWTGILVRWENLFNAFMVPAAAGVATAVIVFGLLIGLLVPNAMRQSNDVPTMLYTPPEISFSPFGLSMGSTNADSVVVEAYVDANGRVQDYRVLSAPNEEKDLTPELKNMLIFTTFKPATAFGQPTAGRAILSFSNVQVKG
jgi:Putative zinc-finger